MTSAPQAGSITFLAKRSVLKLLLQCSQQIASVILKLDSLLHFGHVISTRFLAPLPILVYRGSAAHLCLEYLYGSDGANT